MSERKRFNTPSQNLNATTCSRKTSASKRYSPNIAARTRLNETVCTAAGLSVVNPNIAARRRRNEPVCTAAGPSENPSIKESVTSGVLKTQITETECILAYNDYLQALMKNEIIDKQIKEQEKILQGQILLQESNVNKRHEVLKQIQSDTELLIKKEEIVKMIKTLEENINNIKRVYGNYQTQKIVETVQSALEDKTKVLILKNVHPIGTQEQYNSLIDSLKKLVCACDKIIECHRDFEGVHKLAEECRSLSQIGKKIKESQILLSTMETHAVTTLLQKLSDMFAKQYENIE